MDRYNIVPRRQTGKLMVSRIKQEHIEKEVAFHLGVVSRVFKDNLLDQYLVDNL